MASPRVLRWNLTLAAYDYTISYKPGCEHANGDAMSRLPLNANVGQVPTPGDVVLLPDHMPSNTTVSPLLVKNWTQRDPVI